MGFGIFLVIAIIAIIVFIAMRAGKNLNYQKLKIFYRNDWLCKNISSPDQNNLYWNA
jgi:ABC-type phosphate transport system permease subunit